MQAMAVPLKADDIVPLIAALTPQERVRLLRLISKSSGDDSSAYGATPVTTNEFGTDEDPLQWESDGWETVV